MKGPTLLLEAVETPRGLREAVLRRLALARRRAARVRLVAFAAIMAFSGTALAYALSYAIREFYASGFYDYITLLATDHSLALDYSRDFLYSLAESLPSLAILLLAVCAAALLWSVVRTLQSASRAFAPLPAHG